MHGTNKQSGSLQKIFRFTVAACSLGLANLAYGVDWSGPTRAELALLPPYCEAKMNEGSPNRAYWSRALGPVFESVHHYCAGQNFMNRYYRSAASDRASYLKFALDNFNYMLKSPDRTSAIVPEIYVQRGLALKLSKQDSAAINDFYKALELNPRYGKAYLELINYFVDAGQRAKALDVATESLRYLPDAKILRKRYDELGGSQPYPEPVVAADEAPREEGTAETVQVDTQPDQPQEEGAATMPAADGNASVPPEDFPRKSGENPWCRFCTE